MPSCFSHADSIKMWYESLGSSNSKTIKYLMCCKYLMWMLFKFGFGPSNKLALLGEVNDDS